MGIHDRDYMKRRREGDDDPSGDRTPLADADSRLENFFSSFLARNPRFLTYLAFALGAVILIALVIAKFS